MEGCWYDDTEEIEKRCEPLLEYLRENKNRLTKVVVSRAGIEIMRAFCCDVCAKAKGCPHRDSFESRRLGALLVVCPRYIGKEEVFEGVTSNILNTQYFNLIERNEEE